MSEVLQEYYQEQKWSFCAKRYHIFAENINKYLQTDHLKLLEIGSADGEGLVYLSQKIKVDLSNLWGIEVSKKGVDLASEKGINSLSLDLNTTMLPFEDNFFDVVISSHVIEHILNMEHHIKEINRVLKPGGLFCVITPNLGSIFNIVALFLGFQPQNSHTALEKTHGNLSLSFLRNRITEYDANGHIHNFARNGLIYLLESFGFQKVEFIGIPWVRYKNFVHHKIMYAFELLLKHTIPFWCSEIGIVSRKKLNNHISPLPTKMAKYQQEKLPVCRSEEKSEYIL